VGTLDEAVLRSDYSAMKAAIASGENINGLSSGLTPLLSAVFRGDVEAVQILLDCGADPNVRSDAGDSPLWHAEDDFGLVEIAALLKSHGAEK
jgi:uncharacterized protein